ncbi:EAL domain-containing response regulator [Sansalvadorimonas verongulae]|uniref:EAL domain-containing response regulator n=1 Tax=Sansalvadorimonas verongulae TaxID=2172824 RepID=UPI0012BD7A0E|nr:EAL domain-containing response regulator [Sansalvadorimonas verongulae]MTI13464.1 EAL domain-containing protein [Sansalvadorimonas verongulae]
MSDSRVWKVLVLNGTEVDSAVWSSALDQLGGEFLFSYPTSLDHLKTLLNDERFDFIVAYDTSDAIVPPDKALIHQITIQPETPFIVVSSEYSSSTVVKWLKAGARDVVPFGCKEHISLVTFRELSRSHNLSTNFSSGVEETDDSVQKVLTKLLSTPVESRSEKLFFMIEIQEWTGLLSRLGKEKTSVARLSVIDEIKTHLKPDSQVEIIEEKFIYVITDAGEKSPEQIAYDVVHGMDQLFIDIDEHSLQVGISMAVVPLNCPFGDFEELDTRAKELLQEVQTMGANKFKVFSQAVVIEKQASEGDAHALVQHALDNNSFELHFQPVASLSGDPEEHYDVLLRVVDPQGKNVSAGQFIGVIDRTPLAEKIDKWVILHSIKRLVEHKKSGGGSHLFLHLSSATIQDNKFLPWLFLLLKKAGVAPSSLIFQFSEEGIARYKDQALKMLGGMNKIGCRTSISHFGSTMNPMRIAEELKTDYVKLDGKLTEHLAEDSEEEKQVHEMIEKLEEMSRRVIVPQIENPNVMTKVWRTGASYVQGYFLQKPKPDMDYDFSADD